MTPRRGSAAVHAREKTPFDAHDGRAGNGNGSRSPAPRIIAALAALIVGTGGFAVALIAFGGDARRPIDQAEPPITPVPKANGAIYFRIGGGGPSRIEAVEPDGSGRRVVFDTDPTRIAQIAWSPDGTRMAYQNPIAAERGIYVANADGSDAVRLTDGINDAWPSWSPDGTRILFSSSSYDSAIELCEPAGADFTCPTDIYVMEADGSNVVRLTTDIAPEYQPAWSPDGGRIAFVRVPVMEAWDEIFNAPRIFTMNPEGGDVRQVSTGTGGSDFSPTWSADGSHLAFAAIRYEDWGIWVVNADGSNEHLVLGSAMAGHVEDPEWSPDGRLIAFIGNLEVDDYSPDDALYVIRPDGTEVAQLATSDGYPIAGDIAWQPISNPSETPAPIERSRSEVVLQPRAMATIEVGAFPRAIVVGEGTVWATVDNANGGLDDHLLVEIDPATNQVVRSIPLPEAGDVAFGRGALWVTSWYGGESVLLRVDLSTAEVIASIPLGWNADDVAFGYGAVWVTVTTDGASPAGEVLRIDPVTSDVVARIAVTTGWPRDVVVGQGSVWVYGHSKLEEHGWVASSLWRIDPTTNQVAATVLDQNGFLGDGGFLPNNVAVEDGWAWAADDRGNGVRIDAASGALTTFRPGDGSTEPNGFGWPFLAYAGHVFFGLDPIRVLDTETFEVVASIPLESQVADAALDPVTGTLWIANYEGTVTRIDLH
jgi:DNA-binding beta-propeller fold protein YncE